MDDSKLKISFSTKYRCIRIYREVFRALGNPGCFRFLMDEKTNRLAIQVCAFGDEGFHIAPDFSDKDPKWSYRMYSLEMLRMLWRLCGWISDNSYRASGVLYPDIQAVIFELNAAKNISDTDFETEECTI